MKFHFNKQDVFWCVKEEFWQLKLLSSEIVIHLSKYSTVGLTSKIWIWIKNFRQFSFCSNFNVWLFEVWSYICLENLIRLLIFRGFWTHSQTPNWLQVHQNLFQSASTTPRNLFFSSLPWQYFDKLI